MNQIAKRSLALLMALIMCIGLLPALQFTSDAAGYVYNWGKRGETATKLSDSAESFYAKYNVSYDELAALTGGTTTANAYTSDLYEALQDLMAGAQTYQTSYDATRDLYKYTDCQEGGGKISSFYSGAEIGPDWDKGSTWNREHTWPNSKGDMSGNGENDIMMLRPASVSENSSRNNKAYGESSGYYNPNKESSGTYNLHGDVARIVLYVYVRWGCTNTGSDYNPDDIVGTDGVIESLDVLLKWMEEDPVDTWEMGRNDSVQSITGTRNVFVDYPELAFLLFGEEVPNNYTTPSGEGNGDCGHNNFLAGTPVEATCTTIGYTLYTCQTEGCGYSYKGDKRPALDHIDVDPEDGICDRVGCGAAMPAAPAPSVTPVETVAAGTAYKFGMVQGNVSQTDVYYLAGGMAQTYYFATTSNVDEAIDVYLEETTGGYYFYTMTDTTKTYINMVVSGTHVNGVYETTASTVYTWDAEHKTIVAQVNGEPYWFGTRNDETYTTVGPNKTSYNGFYCQFYATGSEGSGETPAPSDDPTPDSTLTIPEAIALGSSKAHNTYTAGKYYVVGEITEVYNTEYGNMKIKDAEGNILTIYGTYSADGTTRYDALTTKPVAGDTVKIYGIIGQYNGTPQMKNGWIVEHTPGSGGTTPNPDPDPNPNPDQPGVTGEATITFDDKNKRIEYSTSIQVWQENGITVTNNKAASTTNVGDYANPARFYKNSELIIEYPGMTRIVFSCASPYNNDDYAAYLVTALTGHDATVARSGNTVTVELVEATDRFVIGALSGGQVRVSSITVFAVATETECDHTNLGDWEYDADGHWQTCECGEKVNEGEHQEGKLEGEPASCTAPGWTDGVECSVCHKVLTAREEIPATGHRDTEVIPYVAPTRTQPGSTAGIWCNDCDTAIFATEVIPALGYSIYFVVPNGVEMAPVTGATQWTFTAPTNDPENCEFIGWVTEPVDNQELSIGELPDMYKVGDTITLNADMVLYALYKVNPAVVQPVMIMSYAAPAATPYSDVATVAETPAATISFASISNRSSYSTSKQVWEQNGIKVTNNKGSSTSDVNEAYNPVRFYANSELIIQYTGMTRIEAVCGNESYASAFASSFNSVTGADATANGKNVVVELSEAVNSVTIKMAAQARVNSISVYTTPISGGGSDEPDTAYTWTKVNLADIQATDTIAITMTMGTSTWALYNANGTGSAPTAFVVTPNGETMTTEELDKIAWNISNNNGTLTIYVAGTTAKWLYCNNSNNGVRVGTESSKTWVVDATSGYLKNTTRDRYLGVYNSQDWRAYTNTTGNTAGQTLSFWKLNTDSTEPECDHTNTTLSDWVTTDDNNHWKTCECGAEVEKAPHTYGAWIDGKKTCTCGKEITCDHTNTTLSDWVTTDETNHWKTCECGAKVNEAAHTYGSWTEGKKTCTCGKEITCNHTNTTLSGWVTTDETNHWKVCECGVNVQEAPHVFDQQTGECECGATETNIYTTIIDNECTHENAEWVNGNLDSIQTLTHGDKIHSGDLYCPDCTTTLFEGEESNRCVASPAATCFVPQICTCGEVLEEAGHDYIDGICSECGEVCEHDYEDGVCIICSYECKHEVAIDAACEECGIALVAQIGNVYYATLKDAVAAAEAGDTIVLLTDVTEEEFVNASGLTVDLNGHKLTADIAGTIKMNGGIFATSQYVMVGATEGKYISADGIFTIALTQTMDMTFHSGTVALNEELWYTLEGQTLTVEADATFEIPENMTLYVNGSTVIIEGTVANSGTILLKNGAEVEGTITMCTAVATVEGPKGLTVVTTIADHKVVYENGIYKVVAKVYVAQIGETRYESLQEALDAAIDGDTVKLLMDIEVSKYLDVYTANNGETARNFTLDLNGCTIAPAEDYNYNTGYPLLFIGINQTLTITDTSDEADGMITAAKKVTVGVYGILNLVAGTVKNDIQGNPEEDAAIVIYHWDNDLPSYEGVVTGTGNITGGTVTGVVYSEGNLEISGGQIDDLYVAGGETTVTGGTFGTVEADEGATIAISGGTFANEVPEEYCADGFVPVQNPDGSYGVEPDCEHPNMQLINYVPVTCTSNGYSGDWYCPDCQTILERGEPIISEGHNYEEVVTPETCGADGYTEMVCSECGDSYLVEGSTVPATGNHVFGAWTLLKAPACNDSGLRTRACECGAIQTEVIPATGIHTYGEWTETKAPTCTDKGEKTRTCGCGAVETASIAALGHTEIIDAGKPATCTVAGTTDGKHCSVCNEVLVAQETISALGHTEITDAGKRATCTENGLTDGKHCSVCNEVLIAQQTLNATGHSFGAWIITKEATETEAGEETRTCGCGATETREIPVLSAPAKDNTTVVIIVVVVAVVGIGAAAAFVFLKKKRA